MAKGREVWVGDTEEEEIDKCRQMTDKYPSTQQDNQFFLKLSLCGTAFATKLLAPVL